VVSRLAVGVLPVRERAEAAAVARLRVAVAGAGAQATTHLIPALLHLPQVELVAVCDPDSARAAATAARFSIPARFQQVGELLDAVEVSALVAACPPQSHEEIIACALTRDVPIFVEKPPAVDLGGLRALVAAATKSWAPTGVGMNFRHAGPYLRVKELLADPECGTAVAVTVRHLASKPRSGLWGLPLLRSFLLAQAIHPVDLLVDLGGPVTSVRAFRRVRDHDVLVGAQLEFADGAVGSLLSGTHAPRFDTRVEVVTDAGVMVSLAGLAELTVAGLPAAKAADGSRGWSQQWRPSPLDSGYARTGFLGELASFAAAVATRRPFHPSLVDLLPTYAILDELERG
jgi:phthalate 4,5-cis-dihydrodiol dehydrogenase